MIEVLTVGNLIPRKRLELCLDACKRMVRNGLNVHWTIIGDGPWRDKLIALAPPQVDIINRVPRLRDRYKRADVFALPSYDEAFGMVYVESIICGTPVVCAKGEGGEEIVRHTRGGVAIDCAGVGAAERIAGATRDMAKRGRLGRDVRAMARSMVDPGVIGAKWGRLLREVSGNCVSCNDYAITRDPNLGPYPHSARGV